jgi:hypothetical protein
MNISIVILVLVLILFILFIVITPLIVERKAKANWKRNPIINIDKRIQNYNDEYRKIIDGPHYKEGVYWVLVNSAGYTPWIMCSKNKSVIRFAARLLLHKHYGPNRIHSSNALEGKYLVDHAHARRYTDTLNLYYLD